MIIHRIIEKEGLVWQKTKKNKSWLDRYEIIGELGKGGNGKVYYVKNTKDSKEVALKELVKESSEKCGRFIDEINIMKNNCMNIEGIIPILESSVDEYWYTMPIAKPAVEYINENHLDIKETVKGGRLKKGSMAEISQKNEVQRKIKAQKETKKYIEKNFMNWDFSDVLQNQPPTNSETIKFAFRFKLPDSKFSSNLFKGIYNCICLDGYIREKNPSSDSECYYLYNREIAINLRDKLKNKMNELLKQNNLVELEQSNTCFEIEIIRCGNPTHLFTKQEIESAMRNADDRFHNQLVIDENGYAKVIQNKKYGILFIDSRK